MWIFPFVKAAAIINVPVSILSGIISADTGFRFETPSIVITDVPAPLILAPILFNTSARAIISGSRAVFLKVVTPSATAAAIIIFSVPVTVMVSK